MSKEFRRLIAVFSGHSRPLLAQGKNIDLLRSPDEFFSALLGNLDEAKMEANIASLYNGVGGGREREFLKALHDCATSQDVKLTLLLDALRGTRPTKDAEGGLSSSASKLAPLLSEKTAVGLFHTPALRGVLKRVLPSRINEAIGVSHVKAFLFDDTLLMSGANLSNDYFTVRQDRYMVFKDCPHVIEWTKRLIQVLKSHSYQLDPTGALSGCPAGVDPIKKPIFFCQHLQAAVLKLATPSSCEPQRMVSDQKQEQARQPLSPKFTKFHDILEEVSQVAEHALGAQAVQPATEVKALPFQQSSSRDASGDGHVGEDTWVFPSVQFGCANIRQDEDMTTALIESAQPGGTLILSSPYLNLAKRYQQALAKASKVNIELLTASPSANGFFGAAGAAGFIPMAYSLLQRGTWRLLLRAWRRQEQQPAVTRKLLEYEREGWQYHAKGIWYVPPGETLPLVTTIGSPNFGYRSVNRDLEFQFFLVTTNLELRKKLKSEVDELRKYATDVSGTHALPLKGVSYRARLAAQLMRSFL